MSQSTTSSRAASPWAVILIAVGVIWLLAQADIFNSANLSVLFRFWPLILIAFGLELLVGRNNRQLSLLIVAGTVILLLALMLIGPSIGLAQTSEVKMAQYSEPLSGADQTSITINANVASVEINPIADEANLFDADINYVGDINFERNGGEITLESRGNVGMSNFFFFDWFGEDLNNIDWNIGINPNVPLDLHVTTGTGGGRLDLQDLNLTELYVNTGTGSVDMWLPSMDDTYDATYVTGTGGGTITIEENATVRLSLRSGTGGMTVDVPEGSAVQVRGSVGTGGIDVPSWLVRVSGGDDNLVGESGTWESANFDAAERQITIDFNGGTGGLTVR